MSLRLQARIQTRATPDAVGGGADRLGRVPVGLLDRFVVTGWAPPTWRPGGVEVLHLGPYVAGEAVFQVAPAQDATQITAIEVFSLPGGRITDAAGRLAVPLLRRGLTASLARLASVSEATAR